MLCAIKINLLIYWLTISVNSKENNKNATQQNITNNCIKVITNNQSFITSNLQNFASNSSNTNCSYIFKGPSCPTVYTFKFLNFRLPFSKECVKNRFEIQSVVLCGNITGRKFYYSANGTLTARFISHLLSKDEGFKILVKRSFCFLNRNNMTFDWQNKINSVLPNITNYQTHVNTDYQYTPQFCCKNIYNSKHFFLLNPGFPRSYNQQQECIYRIYRANHNICRLRLHFLYFRIEKDSNYSCNSNFLQIDGKSICGCKIGLKLISSFDALWNNTPKVFIFKNNKTTKNIFNGFVIEVIQDECPERVKPTNGTFSLNYLDNKNISQAQSKQLYSIKSADSIDTSSHVSTTKNWNSNILQHFYYFDVPKSYNLQKGFRDREETNYVDILELDALPFDSHDNCMCERWGAAEWSLLYKRILWSSTAKCDTITNSINNQQCENVNFVKGYIQSPNYPAYYPAGLNICYRIERQPGYCGVNIAFIDFNLEHSYECNKDYLLVDGKFRYCGNSLHRATLKFDFYNSFYEQFTLVTRDYSCKRGFYGVFEQIPCRNNKPVYPSSSTTPFPYLPPSVICRRNITTKSFSIQVDGYSNQNCEFIIQKWNPNVCRLSLTFYHFNLFCGKEQLLINNEKYCGQLTGKTVDVMFNNDPILIIYERFHEDLDKTGLKFMISGNQMTEECEPNLYPNVPAERFLFNPNNPKQK